jgi:hypothetical protein
MDFNPSLGYLMFFDRLPVQGGGFLTNAVFSPNGKVEGYTKEDVDEHNRLLSRAEIDGLDRLCEVNQGGYFYFNRREIVRPNKRVDIKTWNGDLVGVANVTGFKVKTLTFVRNGKTMRARTKRTAENDCAFFKRIA